MPPPTSNLGFGSGEKSTINKGEEEVTLTGGVEAALTTKEAFLVEDWEGLPTRICLSFSTEEVIEDEESNACVAIFSFGL